jgi:hypothetical protein
MSIKTITLHRNHYSITYELQPTETVAQVRTSLAEAHEQLVAQDKRAAELQREQEQRQCAYQVVRKLAELGSPHGYQALYQAARKRTSTVNFENDTEHFMSRITFDAALKFAHREGWIVANESRDSIVLTDKGKSQVSPEPITGAVFDEQSDAPTPSALPRPVREPWSWLRDRTSDEVVLRSEPSRTSWSTSSRGQLGTRADACSRSCSTSAASTRRKP